MCQSLGQAEIVALATAILVTVWNVYQSDVEHQSIRQSINQYLVDYKSVPFDQGWWVPNDNAHALNLEQSKIFHLIAGWANIPDLHIIIV